MMSRPPMAMTSPEQRCAHEDLTDRSRSIRGQRTEWGGRRPEIEWRLQRGHEGERESGCQAEDGSGRDRVGECRVDHECESVGPPEEQFLLKRERRSVPDSDREASEQPEREPLADRSRAAAWGPSPQPHPHAQRFDHHSAGHNREQIDQPERETYDRAVQQPVQRAVPECRRSGVA